MRSFVSVVVASVALAGQLAAQQTTTPDSKCPSGTVTTGIPDQAAATQDACQKTIDLFRYMAPQLGTAVAGGAPTLGQGGTLGGIGHFSIGVRVNAVQGSVPQITGTEVQPTVFGPEQDTYPTQNQILPMPTADVAIGLFGGIPLGVTSVGGLDLLISATYLPEFEADDFSVDVDGSSLKVGFGARLGLLEESLVVPGVSFSYLRRDLPKINMTARSGADSLQVTDFQVKTTSWRLMAGKSFFMFGAAAGFGKDRYESSADVRVSLAQRAPFTTRTEGTVSDIEQSVTRTNIFLDLSMNLPFFKIVGEIGQVSGGEINTYNQFEGKKADDSRTYGSIGLRFGF